MPDYAYIARDATGQKVSGTLSAATEREVLGILSGRSLFPVQVTDLQNLRRSRRQPSRPRPGDGDGL